MNFGFSILDFGLGRTIRKAFFWIEARSENNLKSKIQNRKWAGIVALDLALALVVAVAHAQQPGKVYRIGYLANPAGIGSNEEILRQSLRELGYIEGKNLFIEWRFSKGKLDRHPELAAELVRLKVDCIIAIGVTPTRIAREATSTIPIVMGNADDDPVRHGLVVSLARPGGNVTGFTNVGSGLAGKRLELIKEVLPKLSRAAILWDPKGQGGVGHARETEIAAPTLGVQLQRLEVRAPQDLENVFQAAVKERAGALIIVTSGLMNSHRPRIVNLAIKTRLPAMYSNPDFVGVGGLMSYAADPFERLRGVAAYVDKILKGTKPADLPVQQPTKFELVINLKTAKQIGLNIPSNVLARADPVIK
jgi:putative ABC transport system substrate-binding protein